MCVARPVAVVVVVLLAGCGRSGPPLGNGSFGPLPGAPSSGQLDLAFGDSGLAITAIDDGLVARAVALTVDGTILVAATAEAETEDADWVLLRFGADGRLDPTFAEEGMLQVDLGGRDDAHSLLIVDGGRIVVTGVSLPFEKGSGLDRIHVRRFEPDGSSDPTFGQNGEVLHWLSSPEVPALLHRVASGSLFLTSSDVSQGSTRFVVERLTADGALDGGFGVAGHAGVTVASSAGWISGITEDDAGRITVTGVAAQSQGRDAVLARFLGSGEADASLGGTGVFVDAALGTDETPLALAVQEDGRIVTGGRVIASGTSTSDLALARYSPAGALDESFGTFGRVTLVSPALHEDVHAVAIDGAGGILAVGAAGLPGSERTVFSLFRLLPDGSLDDSFATNGRFSVDVPGSVSSEACAYAFGPDGRLVVAGTVHGEDGPQVLVASFLPGEMP